ncbi:Inositol 2-dehydrogenase/D-chiro-inositol 3-dehydrogenase [Paenibacillus solanacearum]|uniref:Inositol 2-dehydrogenase/D-chiro-inositol 3-dehydrogenase n=1 Tax=Paenibacillus solanacearum TaxID=2048548 RepID=A0A916K3A2_9BACL|nr:Gfo/Idh/MocA family oxidoreductase [Paenibacillus solanacearum]CAG7629037.1 Inositol 2-dehydrogenase/D-chiro-inositol 3-dehydrogenase [Paenibacillus solanacearum]
MKQITAVLIGTGNRGGAYTSYALQFPHELKIVAIADPNHVRSGAFAKKHNIPQEQVYQTWEELLLQPQLADVAIVTTQDSMHYEPTIHALEKGYHVLVEKPMSPNPEECIRMEEAAEKHNRQLSVCHVLRYTPFWSGIKKIIDRGDIGEIASIQLNENVGNLHMAHSFVRGNWRNSDVSSPMILAKSSHDMDIISWLMGKACTRVSSFGSLLHFRKEHAPEGAPEFCLDGCPVYSQCPYYAPKYYMDKDENFLKKITNDTSHEGVLHALQTGPYGKCVYRTDNNVVDHQVVNLEFAGGATATFSMCGFTHDTSRSVQIMGTKGEIRGYMSENKFTVYDFLTRDKTEVRYDKPKSGHSGGDAGIIKNFLHEIRYYDGKQGLTSAKASVESHMMAFAAEKSRNHQGESIDLIQFKADHKNEATANR